MEKVKQQETVSKIMRLGCVGKWFPNTRNWQGLVDDRPTNASVEAANTPSALLWWQLYLRLATLAFRCWRTLQEWLLGPFFEQQEQFDVHKPNPPCKPAWECEMAHGSAMMVKWLYHSAANSKIEESNPGRGGWWGRDVEALVPCDVSAH